MSFSRACFWVSFYYEGVGSDSFNFHSCTLKEFTEILYMRFGSSKSYFTFSFGKTCGKNSIFRSGDRYFRKDNISRLKTAFWEAKMKAFLIFDNLSTKGRKSTKMGINGSFPENASSWKRHFYFSKTNKKRGKQKDGSTHFSNGMMCKIRRRGECTGIKSGIFFLVINLNTNTFEDFTKMRNIRNIRKSRKSRGSLEGKRSGEKRKGGIFGSRNLHCSGKFFLSRDAKDIIHWGGGEEEVFYNPKILAANFASSPRVTGA